MELFTPWKAIKGKATWKVINRLGHRVLTINFNFADQEEIAKCIASSVNNNQSMKELGFEIKSGK